MKSETDIDLVLASASPRRREILTQLGVKFRVSVSNEEEKPTSKSPLDLPKENACIKAISVSKKESNSIVLGYDTLVFLDGVPLGKPQNKEDAFKMLLALNDRSHFVITGVAIAKNGKILESNSETTEVIFRNNSPEELKAYIETLDPMDKAGAYGIQSNGARLVASIHGCFYNVAGLPVALSLDLLKKLKVNV